MSEEHTRALHHLGGVRSEVAEFAVAMEAKLAKNDHKSSWQKQPIEAHIRLLRIEMMEFDVALEFLGDEEACKECVDIANFALIIRDKLKARMAAKKQAQHDAQKAAGAGYQYDGSAAMNELWNGGQ